MITVIDGQRVKIGIPGHAIQRWYERVEACADAKLAIDKFLRDATFEGFPRKWTFADEAYAGHRGGVPLWFAYNTFRLDVCIVIARYDPPQVLTVITRQMAKATMRNRRQHEEWRRRHSRRLNTAS